MPDYGKRTGRDAFESLERRLASAERELRRGRGGGLSTFDRGDTLTQPAPVEGQTLIQYDTDEPWYFANGEWRDFCCPVTSGGPSLASTIEGMVGLDGFWKLNESAGVVAADSSGNGYTMSDAGGGHGPVTSWGSTVGPPGETSAYFNGPTLSDGFRNGALPRYTDNVTFLGWVKDGTLVVGGYGGAFFGGSAQGWGMYCSSGFARLWVAPGGGSSATILSSNTTLAAGWSMLAARRQSGTWNLFVNGVAQTATSVLTPSMPSVGFFSLGTDWDGTGFYGNLSYMALFGRALSDAEIAGLHTTATSPTSEAAGKAYSADGSGGMTFRYPVGVWINGSTVLEGLGTNFKSAPSGLLVPSSVWNATLKAVDVTHEMVGPADASQVLVGTNPPTWAQIAVGRIFYLATSDTSDIATYKTLLIAPSAGAEQAVATVCTGTGDVLVAAFATDPGVPGAVDYPAGTATRNLYASVSGGAARLHLRVYVRDAGGTETLVRDELSPSFSNTSAALQSWIVSAVAAGSLLATDRLVAKLYAQRVSGPSTVTVTTYFEGTTHTSQVQTTIPSTAGGGSSGGGGASATDTAGWMPLTTVIGGVPDLVWDAADNLIPTFTTF